MIKNKPSEQEKPTIDGRSRKKQQTERILNYLDSSYKPMTQIARDCGVLIYRARELLSVLLQEGKVEMKMSARGTYSYWRKR